MSKAKLEQIAIIAATCFMILPASPGAETLTSSTQPQGTIHKSLANEIDAAIERGLSWLASRQSGDGYWSNAAFPALTALATDAFLASQHAQKQAVVEAALKYILSCVQADGGIYRNVPGRKGGGLSNYNTAICMTTLNTAGDPDLKTVVRAARKFIANSQHFGDDIYTGGFGYDNDTHRAYTDLMNTYYATRAMRLTQNVEDSRPPEEARVDLDWNAAIDFIERMQNKPTAGEDDVGGFFYNPSDPKAGTTTNNAGVIVFRSYGSITYAGMLAMIYSNIDRSDPRVLSAFDWASKHWSLNENPGMGQQGLYFFYHILTRALNVYGADLIPLQDGALLNWRESVAKVLVGLQKIDTATGYGYWVNENGRYWENDPVLVTAYCLLALQALQ